MRPELRELYQDVILDHGKRPRNFRSLVGATHHAEGFNPLCGDRVRLDLVVDGGTIRDASFQGQGCAISTASASMMTEAVKGRSLDEARALFAAFHRQVTGQDGQGGEGAAAGDGSGELGKLEVFGGVQEYPTRIKCAILVWHTLMSALEKKHETVTTE